MSGLVWRHKRSGDFFARKGVRARYVLMWRDEERVFDVWDRRYESNGEYRYLRLGRADSADAAKAIAEADASNHPPRQ